MSKRKANPPYQQADSSDNVHRQAREVQRAWKALPVDGSPGEVLGFAFAFDQDGRLPWDTIISSCIKKSGKTTMNGAVTLGRGFTQEAFNLK